MGWRRHKPQGGNVPLDTKWSLGVAMLNITDLIAGTNTQTRDTEIKWEKGAAKSKGAAKLLTLISHQNGKMVNGSLIL